MPSQKRSIRLASILLASALALPAAAQPRPSLDFLDVPARPRPSQDRVGAREERGLDELEAELGRFDASASAYRTALDQLALRRLRAQRRELDARFGRAIRDERRLEAEARATTMQELERFLARHPSPSEPRADALLRLAELSLLASLDRLDRRAAGDGQPTATEARSAGADVGCHRERSDQCHRGEIERPDFDRAIALARQLLAESPRYRHLDHAAYLLGYALTESERPDEALAAWRGLVCADRFGFAPAAASSQPEPVHPALSGARGPRDLGVDPYVGCTPAMDSALASEVWLRIGEHHFEGGHAELAAAMSAYARVASDERDPLYGFGLYKLAWSHYRASQFAEAVERFGQLVAWSDARERATGRAGSELRSEAVQYIAIALAYEDWNEDGTPDRAQGGPSALERMRDPSLVPQDARWSHDVRRATGDALFEEARYPEAIAAWREALARQPGACDAADVALSIARAHRRLGQSDEALAALGAIAEQGEGDRFALCTAAERDRARRLSEQALAASGAFHHRLAQGLRASERLEEASHQYALAVRAYRMHIERFPSAPASYQLGFDMADALYWSGRYEEAAEAYDAIVRSRFDDRLMARAARRVVESLTRALEAEVASGALALREHPPALAGGAVTAEAVPAALQRVARAREIYVRWVEHDEEGVRDAYAFNNAALLYRYGFWPEARARFLALYEAGCAGPRASRIAGDALLALRDMAAAREDTAELARLAADVRSRACTFDPSGPPVRAEGCVVQGSLPCELEAIDGDVAFARLAREAAALSAIADRDQRRSRAEAIARGFVAAADRAPHHPHAPLALHRAAHLLSDESGRPGEAERVYQRIADEVPAHASGDRAALDRIVADAHFELARIAHRTFDVERALTAYGALAESERFARSADPEVQRVRRDALVNAALLASEAGYHARAAEAWARAARALSGGEAREARLRGAEERLASGDARAAARDLDGWLRAQAGSDALTVRAWSARAEAAARLNDRDTRERALLETVQAHRALGAGDASSAVLAAGAALAVADLRAQGFTPARIRVAPRATVRESVDELARAVRADAARLRALIEAYDEAIAIGHAPVTAAALTRQGELYEALVRGVLAAEVEAPRDVARALRGASAGAQRDARAQFADAIRARLDELVRPVECRAVERYVLATRLSRRLGAASEDVDHAHARLAAYGEERVADCLREATARDATFAPYAPGELERARPGRLSPPRERSAPPALAR